MINIGILGTGFGLEHLKIYEKIEDANVRGLFGRDIKKLSKARREHNITVYTDPDELIADNKIDLVDICLPTNLHTEFITKALARNKRIICETPLCTADADFEMLRTYKGKNIAVSSFIKYIGEYEYLKQTIESGELGPLLHLRLKRYTPAIWGDLGLDSIVFNLMIHDLDFVAWLFSSPKKIQVNSARNSGTKSMVVATLSFEDMDVTLCGVSCMPGPITLALAMRPGLPEDFLNFHQSCTGKAPKACFLNIRKGIRRRLR